MQIRQAQADHWPAIWAMVQPVFRAGTTYAVARDISQMDARYMWLDSPAMCLVAERDGVILGTCYIKPNASGGGAHVCNCGYIVDAAARGQGVAETLCRASQDHARALGFTAMQFNMVLESNAQAVRLWQRLGFDIVGTVPDVFDHPDLGLVAGHVMIKSLK